MSTVLLATKYRLTLISAPAGFGKTTPLSDWVAGLSETGSGAATAWLSLDDADNDLTRLLTHRHTGGASQTVSTRT